MKPIVMDLPNKMGAAGYYISISGTLMRHSVIYTYLFNVDKLRK